MQTSLGFRVLHLQCPWVEMARMGLVTLTATIFQYILSGDEENMEDVIQYFKSSYPASQRT